MKITNLTYTAAVSQWIIPEEFDDIDNYFMKKFQEGQERNPTHSYEMTYVKCCKS